MRSIVCIFFSIILLLSFQDKSFSQVQLDKNAYFDYIGPFRNGFAPVAIDNKFGFINGNLQLIVPCIYENYQSWDLGACFVHGLVPVKLNGKWGMIDTLGKEVLNFEYTWINPMHVVAGITVLCKNNKLGFINKMGEFITPIHYDKIWYPKNGLCKVERGSLIGYIDTTGKEIIPCKYEDGHSLSKEGLIPVKLKGKWGYMNKQEKVIIPFQYEFAGEFNEGLATVSNANSAGFISVKGDTIIPFVYTKNKYYEFSNGFVQITKNDKYGYINKQGKVVVPFEYDDCYSDNTNGLLVLAKGKQKGLCDSTGKLILGFDYNQIYTYPDFILVKKENRTSTLKTQVGHFSKKGEVIIPMIYEDLIQGSQGLVYAVLNGKAGYLDKKGNVVIPFKYDAVNRLGPDIYSSQFDDKYAFVCYKGINQLIDTTGNCVLGCLENGIVGSTYKNGQDLYTGRIANFLKEGEWKYYHENGILSSIRTYEKGRINGTYKRWNDKNQLTYDANYINDTLHGTETEYDSETGKLKSTTKYDHGKYDYSTSLRNKNRYYDNGKIKTLGQSIGYHKQGEWREGILDTMNTYIYRKGIYLDNQKEGLWKYYSDKDSLLFEETYNNKDEFLEQNSRMSYNPFMKTFEKGIRKDYQKEGEWKSYYLNGKLFKVENYKQNELVGPYTEYFPSGTIKTQGNYKLFKVKKDSIYKEVTDKVIKKLKKGAFLSPKKSGVWKHYYPDGNLKNEEFFDLRDLTYAEIYAMLGRSEKDHDSTSGRNFWYKLIRSENSPCQVKNKMEYEYHKNGKVKAYGAYYPVPALTYYEYEDSDNEFNQDDSNPGVMITSGGRSISIYNYSKNGLWKYFDEDGKRIKEEKYDKGKLIQ